MDAGGLLLSERDALESSTAVSNFLVSYQWLAANFLNKRLMLFLFRPKHHCVFHQGVQLKELRVNQSLFCTLDDESFLGRLKNVFKGCHGKTATTRMFSRYLLVLAMVLEDHRRVADLG